MEFFKKLVHEATVYGVMWCPSNKHLLATACKDSFVRIYDLSKKEPVPQTLKGHTKSVFNVVWHPHFNYIIASGSDDYTIRVWDINAVMLFMGV